MQVTAGGFAENLQKTYDRNQRDEVTRFLREAADIALSSLSQGNIPDKRSRWAGGWAGGAYDHRYYRVWYSHPPWSNWGMSYRMNLYRLDSENDSWKVNVEFGHFSGELGSRIASLKIHESQSIEDDRVLVTHTSKDLDDAFSRQLGDTLRRFIEAITPVVNELEGDPNQEGATFRHSARVIRLEGWLHEIRRRTRCGSQSPAFLDVPVVMRKFRPVRESLRSSRIRARRRGASANPHGLRLNRIAIDASFRVNSRRRRLRR